MVAERNPVTGHIQEWIPPDDIKDVFFKFKCHITDIAKSLNISRNCLYEHFKSNAKLKATFDEVEKSLQNEWLDQAEKVVWYSLSLAKDRPGHALKAATYILDRKGEPRGWNAPTANTNSANDGLLEGLINGLNDSKPKPIPIEPNAAEPETNPELSGS